MPIDPRARRTATTLAFRLLGEARFNDLRAAHMARKIRTGRYRSPEIDLLPRLLAPGQSAIDVGANFGLYAYHLALLIGGTGRVYAFEAVPETGRVLRRVLAELDVSERVDVIEKAVGERTGFVEFELPRRRDGSADAGRAAAVPTTEGNRATDDRVKLPLTALDDEIAPGADVAFIKIDVEGSDLFVLRGAGEVLSRSHPSVLVEIAPPLLARHGIRGGDIGDFLKGRGYSTYRFDGERSRLLPAEASDVVGDLLAVHSSRAAAIQPLVAG